MLVPLAMSDDVGEAVLSEPAPVVASKLRDLAEERRVERAAAVLAGALLVLDDPEAAADDTVFSFGVQAKPTRGEKPP